MPGSFELALYSILLITAGGVASIALARMSGVHPAYFFAGCGVVGALFLPFTFPPQSLIVQLSELGALFVIFLSALEIEWDLRSSLNRRTVLLGFVLQLMAALPVMAFFFFVLKSEAAAAITAGIIAAVHAPDRGRPTPAERFLTNKVSGEIGLMGLISEISALVGVSLLIAWAPPRPTTGNLLQEAVGVLLILLILISFLPPALRFLVKRTGEESYALFYLMLVLLVSVTIGVRQAGIEPLFGAYAAGFVLTRFVAEGSRVLERLRFTGHSIIVPAFYIQLGLSGNLSAVPGWSAWLGAAAIFVTSLIARAAFAYLRRLGRGGKVSLSSLMRKSPLVLVLIYIAHARGILPVSVMQSLVLYALLNEIFTVLISGRPKASPLGSEDEAARILLPVSNPETMLTLMNIAGHLGSGSTPAKIYPLNVVPDGPEAEERIRAVENQFNELKPLLAMRDEHIELTARIANDRTQAVAHAARELLTEKILLGLGAIPTLQKPQGYSFLESLAAAAPAQTLIAAHIQADLSLVSQLNIIVAHERLVASEQIWLPVIMGLARRLKANPVFFAEPQVLPQLAERLADIDPRRRFALRGGQLHAGLDLLTLDAKPNAMAIAVLERAHFFPDEKIHLRLPEMMLRAFGDRNFMLLYPGGSVPTRKKKSAWKKLRRFFGFG